jgi:Ca2+-binding EF-hand superfamily protein
LKIFTTLQKLRWNQNKYLRKLFNNVDLDNDGRIKIDELHDALIRGQPNLKFDQRTVQFLVNKYNMNQCDQIDFETFKHLFHFLNEEYERFVAADLDGSGTIDSDKLASFVRKRGYDQYDRNFCNFIIQTINYYIGGVGISFDYFCRIMARLDYLTQSYDFELSANQSYERSYPLRAYVQNNFFNGFW